MEGLLVHHAEDILGEGGDRIWDVLDGLRQRNLVSKVGVSIYTCAQVDAVLEQFNPDIVQLPSNILDQRLLAGGQISRLAARGVEVHVRSVFMQGLLLMKPMEIPSYFAPIKERLFALHTFLAEYELTPSQGALAHVRTLPAAVGLVGVNNADQLAQNIADFSTAPTNLDFSAFAMDDEDIVNPAHWDFLT